MKIEFVEEGHTYIVDGEIASISVTELLHKHGLAPSYKGVSKKKLAEASEEGKSVHKDLENFTNKAGYEPTTPQGQNFKAWYKENVDCATAEQKLAYNYNGMIIAGTADEMGFLKDGSAFIGDHKNTASFDREYVSWQVSLNDYFARQLKGEKVNGKKIHWKGATKFYCFKYDKKTGELTVIELEKIRDEEIERLLECELKGEKYERRELVIEPELQVKFLQAEKALAEIEIAHKQAEATAKELRQMICDLCEKQKVYSWESPSGLVRVSYVGENDTMIVDSSKLKKEFPQVWAKCQKLKHTKSYVRVKVKGEEE